MVRALHVRFGVGTVILLAIGAWVAGLLALVGVLQVSGRESRREERADQDTIRHLTRRRAS